MLGLTTHNKFLVAFLGIHGSGKTTSALKLFKSLSNLGYKCVYFHVDQYAPSRITDHIPGAVKRALHRFLPQMHITLRKTKGGPLGNRLKTSWIVSIIQLLTVALISNVFFVAKFMSLTRGKCIVICDRYFYQDTLYLSRNFSRLREIFIRLIPKPNIIFFIDVPSFVAFTRNREFSQSFYERERESYLNFTRRHSLSNLIIIDGLCSEEEINMITTKLVCNFLSQA